MKEGKKKNNETGKIENKLACLRERERERERWLLIKE
jgi:hypothetical protein